MVSHAQARTGCQAGRRRWVARGCSGGVWTPRAPLTSNTDAAHTAATHDDATRTADGGDGVALHSTDSCRRCAQGRCALSWWRRAIFAAMCSRFWAVAAELWEEATKELWQDVHYAVCREVFACYIYTFDRGGVNTRLSPTTLQPLFLKLH